MFIHSIITKMNNSIITKMNNNKTSKREDDEFISIGKMLKEFMTAEEVLTREVKELGNSAYVNVPKSHIGKEARIFIKPKKEDKKRGKK